MITADKTEVSSRSVSNSAFYLCVGTSPPLYIGQQERKQPRRGGGGGGLFIILNKYNNNVHALTPCLLVGKVVISVMYAVLYQIHAVSRHCYLPPPPK